MYITKIQVWDFAPIFRDGPYAMSFVTQHRLYGRLLSVHTADGLVGLGEIVFYPSLSGQERQERIQDEKDYLPRLIGQAVESLLTFSRHCQGRGLSWLGIAFALETAYFDICARRQNCSVAELLGGPHADSVNDYFSISERSVERIKERLQIAGPDRAVIQLKLGVGSLEEDVVQIKATLAGMNASQTLLADANGGWTVADACDMIVQFDDPRLIWEEPCSLYEDNITVATQTQQPVMLDTCVGNLAAARKALLRRTQDPLVNLVALCIKPASLGGLTVARQIRDLCSQAGMKMRIDGPWCGDIASAAILHLAVGAPPELLIAGCDLREPLDIEPALNGVINLPGCRIAPPTGLGLGIERAIERLGEPEQVYD